MPDENVENLSNTIIQAKKNIKYCSVCCTLTDKEKNVIYVLIQKRWKDYYDCRRSKRYGCL